jgi:hypothetical protein
MLHMQDALGHDAVATFVRDGFLLARGWLDVERDIEPIQRDLGQLIARAATACGATYDVPSDPENFDRGYLELVASFPDVAPIVYDMAKNLVSFQRLIVSGRLSGVFEQLRGTDLYGSAPGANGIRIDRPGVTRHLSPWHQELPYQIRSLDGLTFWIPLVPITQETGPVAIAPGSQRDGICRIVDIVGSGDDDLKHGAFENLRVEGEAMIEQRYGVVRPVSVPGDLLLIDNLTLHASGCNISTRARWSSQIRYFNFRDPYGTHVRWSGSVKHGKTLAQVNEELTLALAFGAPA